MRNHEIDGALFAADFECSDSIYRIRFRPVGMFTT